MPSPARLSAATPRTWIVAEFFIALRLFGYGSLRVDAVLGAASAGASLVGAPVPGQLGVLESAVALTASSFGIPTTVALTIVVLRRLRGCLWMLLGAATCFHR